MSQIKVTLSNQFKRDIKKQYLTLVSPEWNEVYNALINGLPLAEKYRNHPLKGDYKGYMDCHVKPDLVLIYKFTDSELLLARLASHSELFK